MNKNVRSVGLEVDAETTVIAVADQGEASAQVFKSIPYDLPRLLQELQQLGKGACLKVCYEAAPTGGGVGESSPHPWSTAVRLHARS